MRNRPTHACVHTHSARDRYALRPSASKPLEVEALRKYNAAGETYLSPYTHMHQEREERERERDAKEMKSREWRKKRRRKMKQREREREEKGEKDEGREQLLRRPI